MAIAYCEHPLTKEEKSEIRAKGYKILDIKFKPKDLEKGDKVIEKDKPKDLEKGDKVIEKDKPKKA